MGKSGNTGLRRIANASVYSIQGLRLAWRHEAAFRQECVLAILLVPLGAWLGQTAVERVLLVGSCLFVLVVELLNSAVEAAVDRHGDEIHELSGRAKDLGSAAVMLSLLLTGALWCAVAAQRFL